MSLSNDVGESSVPFPQKQYESERQARYYGYLDTNNPISWGQLNWNNLGSVPNFNHAPSSTVVIGWVVF